MSATACLIVSTGTAEGVPPRAERPVGTFVTPGARDGATGTVAGTPMDAGGYGDPFHGDPFQNDPAHVDPFQSDPLQSDPDRTASIGSAIASSVASSIASSLAAPSIVTPPSVAASPYGDAARAGKREARAAGKARARRHVRAHRGRHAVVPGETAVGVFGRADDPTSRPGHDPLRDFDWAATGIHRPSSTPPTGGVPGGVTVPIAPTTPTPPTAPSVHHGTAPTSPAAPAAPRDGAQPSGPSGPSGPGGPGTDVTSDPRLLGAQIFHGLGFDACTAPDLQTMEAWQDSPYGAVGVYIGGRARSCAQPRLTRSWVRAVDDMGWRIVPIYVGSQSPCAAGEHQRQFPIDAAHPEVQGASEGADAVKAAESLGILRDSPIYLDMESYDIRTARCTRPVVAFTQAWSRTLRASGYLPGFYSSADAGITQLEAQRASGAADLPDVMWFARWNGDPTEHEPALPTNEWRPHRRIHQYVGDTRESYDGESLSIDRDRIDAPVAIVS